MRTMIFRTTNKDSEDQGYSALPLAIDPEYFYREQKETRNGRLSYPSCVDDINQFPRYGIEHLLDHRRELVDSRIKMLLTEISQRYKIKGDNLYRINLDQCSFKNLIFDIGDVWDKRRTELERKIIDLEQEKRREQTSFFGDILFLRKELRESLIEKLEDKQRAGLLTDQKEKLE